MSVTKYLKHVGLMKEDEKLVWKMDECWIVGKDSNYKVDEDDVQNAKLFKLSVEEYYNTSDIELTVEHTLSYFMGVYYINGEEVDETMSVFDVLKNLKENKK